MYTTKPVAEPNFKETRQQTIEQIGSNVEGSVTNQAENSASRPAEEFEAQKSNSQVHEQYELNSNEDIVAAVIAGLADANKSALTPVDLVLRFDWVVPQIVGIAERKREMVSRLIAKIEALGDLQDDYDGEGAARVSESAISAARLAVQNLYWAYGVVCGDVGPMADGGVEIETDNEYSHFVLWISKSGQINYLIEKDGDEQSGLATSSDISQIVWKALAE